ncbi:MAG TPA: hypothetical protein VFI22_15540, partial [Thermomicrobiales bacterium]|nr:hypothetical protein [Thermomicrobiales bacterium]
MNWRSMGLVATLVPAMLLSCPMPAFAKVVHESCALTDDGTSLVGSAGYSESFTAGHAGALTSVFLETFNNLDAAETYEVALWAADDFGLPTGAAPLASSSVALPAERGFHTETATFATPAKVAKGQEYALVATVPDAANNGVTVSPNNPCPGTFALSASGSIGAFHPDSQ